MWHELYPKYCNWYHLSGWFDSNGNGVLDHCDYIVLENQTDGKLGWYHVKRVTVTILVTKKPDLIESMYIEFDGEIWNFLFNDPICTIWHEVYPDYCNWFHLSSWEDTNADGLLSPSDQIDMTPLPAGPTEWYHVDEVKTDILVTPIEPDFGDAPDPLYPSLLASNGALHIDWTDEWLGENVNGEIDSKQVNLDEFDDGVAIAGDLMINLELTITISTSGLLGRYGAHLNWYMYLNAWIDWNRDGDWADAGEKIIGTGSPTGSQKFTDSATPVYNIPIPGSAEPGETWLRVRLDYLEDAGANPQPWTHPTLNQEKGPAMFGEVEDYNITIEAPPTPPVGGVWVPIDKFELLAPWIGLASLITVAAASVIYVKRKKKE